MSVLTPETCMSNLKSTALTTSDILAFNTQKFWGSRDPGHAAFSQMFLTGHVQTVPWNMHVKSEVHSFNHFGDISI